MCELKIHSLVVLHARQNNITVAEATYELLRAGIPLDEAQRKAVRR